MMRLELHRRDVGGALYRDGPRILTVRGRQLEVRAVTLSCPVSPAQPMVSAEIVDPYTGGVEVREWSVGELHVYVEGEP
jgi:hypothetical protein